MKHGLLLRKHEHSGHDPNVYPEAPDELKDHPLFGAGGSVGLMSGESPRVPAQIQGGHDALKRHLTDMGLQHQETNGSYETPERSVVVHNPTRQQMYTLGKRFGQEAVVYSQGGKHEMLYTNGPDEGMYHPSLPQVRFHPTEPPPDYWTHLPGKGYMTLYFDWTKKHPAQIAKMPTAASPSRPPTQKSEWRDQALVALRKATDSLLGNMRAVPHAHSYPWHEGHTALHHRAPGPGVLVHPGHFDLNLRKDEDKYGGGAAHDTNDQAAKAGSSHAYQQLAAPYGRVQKGTNPNLKFYHGLEHKSAETNDLLAHHGFQAYYAGGKHGKPDLATKNYSSGHLMIFDPSAGSGGDFGHQEFTDNWRKTHELAHALTYHELNQTYGEGRRMGGLGKHRSTREALRAVHWEHLAGHRQRALLSQMGVHISDEDHAREMNTILHDAVHRAITGKFSEPSDEGFTPHSHPVPLEHALGQVRQAAQDMGLKSDHDLLPKKPR